jgi:two-component system heavy metal sensor histidine kinase CusS
MKQSASGGSLGHRLSWWLAIQTFIGLGLVCLAVYFVTAMTLAQRQDETLDQKTTMIRHLLSEARAAPDIDALRHQLNDFLAGHEELALQLRSPDGRTVYASSTAPPSPPPPVKQRVFEVASSMYFSRPASATLTLGTQEDASLLRRLGWTLTAAAIVGSLVVSVCGFWLVRLALVPVHQLVEQTRRLTASQLEKRLDGSAQPQELQPLIGQFNALLDRLNSAYRQMEGFNADVAHELNTPLATLISACELSLRKSREIGDMRDVLASNLEELRRMSGIVNDMLFLSQADRGAGARRVNVNSLAALAGEVIEFHEAAMQEATLTVEILGDAAGRFDARLLRRALSNLLGNATRYARTGSAVMVRIETRPGGEVSIAVHNTGPTIEPADLPRLFDRFYRVDPARAHADLNHGLGLSIVAAIARMHGGSVFAGSDQGITRIGLLLPPPQHPSDDTPGRNT